MPGFAKAAIALELSTKAPIEQAHGQATAIHQAGRDEIMLSRFRCLAMLAVLALAGCQQQPQQPRGEDYFSAHIENARKVVAACRAGSQGGPECDNAHQAVADADRKAGMDRSIAEAKAARQLTRVVQCARPPRPA
jgi:hypothetical protein